MQLIESGGLLPNIIIYLRRKTDHKFEDIGQFCCHDEGGYLPRDVKDRVKETQVYEAMFRVCNPLKNGWKKDIKKLP